jgi:hypothetical protein
MAINRALNFIHDCGLALAFEHGADQRKKSSRRINGYMYCIAVEFSSLDVVLQKR